MISLGAALLEKSYSQAEKGGIQSAVINADFHMLMLLQTRLASFLLPFCG